MATTSIAYTADETVSTTAMNSLAPDDWASLAAVDNTSNLHVDGLIGGIVAMSATTLAAGESVDLYLSALHDNDTATTYTGGLGTALTAADSTLAEDTEFTPLNLIFLTSVSVEATTPDTTQNYNWGPIAVAQAFGGHLPQKFMIMVHNNTGSALAASGHTVNFVGIKYTSA